MKKAVRKKVETKVVTKKEKKSEMSELRKLTYIFCGVVGIFLIFYGIANLKAKSTTRSTDATREIQYKEILVSNMGKQAEDVYYVIAYKDLDSFDNLYSPYITTYIATENSTKFYYSDLNSTFNRDYVTGTDSLKDIDNLRINGDVLFKIEKGKITRYYTGSESIIKQLKSLCKITN